MWFMWPFMNRSQRDDHVTAVASHHSGHMIKNFAPTQHRDKVIQCPGQKMPNCPVKWVCPDQLSTWHCEHYDGYSLQGCHLLWCHLLFMGYHTPWKACPPDDLPSSHLWVIPPQLPGLMNNRTWTFAFIASQLDSYLFHSRVGYFVHCPLSIVPPPLSYTDTRW